MANDSVLVANPTPAAITVNGQTVNSGKVATLTVSDATTDLYTFVAKGCTVAPASLTNGTASVTDVLDNATTLVEKGSRLLYGLVRAIQSAGGDTFGVKGL